MRESVKSMGSRDKLSAAAAASSYRRVLLVVFASCFAFATYLTFLYTTPHFTSSTGSSSGSASSGSRGGGSGSALPLPVFDALVHYASTSNATHRMTDTDIRAIAAVLKVRAPCNLLIFGLSAESPLWLALNHGGRTVFLDENEFYVKYLEPRHPGLEAYDVSYTTKVRDFRDLLEAARASRAKECRPVQNLLFSECRLAINDLPNDLYDVAWDMVLIDGPSGWNPTSPGRMPSIFTTAVLTRSGATAAKGPTDVLVHDFQFEVEQVLSKEFLCEENRLAGSGTPSLGHFVIRPGGPRDAFCAGQQSSITSEEKTLQSSHHRTGEKDVVLYWQMKSDEEDDFLAGGEMPMAAGRISMIGGWIHPLSSLFHFSLLGCVLCLTVPGGKADQLVLLA
ncbi:protein IRX15-LIKE-like [Phragmites australis]|uniref:protein IRX15-LIKE-like n=1 Tax=Phragmites australis TaxID=29695 RepID=UPI002D78CE33|nr:protein IRX15-LIKE-like [Phragmites australis]